MSYVVLVTGSSTGIGNLTARTLAAAGHTVYATMRSIEGTSAGHAEELTDFAAVNQLKLKVIPLDVQSQDSANAAVKTVIANEGRLDVVVNNAGHLLYGYAEAFTADDIAHLFDINVLGQHRINRAALPFMRECRSGLLLYIGSTIPFSSPPFLAPYVASKSAGDALAAMTGYEVNPFGIETCIVMPGAFTSGTQHFPNAGHASDQETTKAYAALDPLITRNEDATNSLFTPGIDANPQSVADEVARILALPAGTRPLRSIIDFTNADVEKVTEPLDQCRRDFVTRMGYGEMLTPSVAETC